jgi:hypothetical protein
MIRIKAGPTGCRIAGIQPEGLAAVMVAASVYTKHNLDLVWTAGLDSKHMAGSLHYVGLAIDIGMPPANLRVVMEQELRDALGDDFDLVVEGDHWHAEFQPKRGMNLAV